MNARSLHPRVLSLLLIAILPTELRAEEAAASGAEAVQRAKALFEKRDFARARLEFELAHRLRPHFTIRCSVATCLERLGRAVEAAEHYRRCLKEGAETSELATEVRASLARVEARITWLSVTEPATIVIDGASLGEGPGRIPLDPGAHLLELRRGEAKRTLTIQTLGGERLSLGEGPTSLPTLGAAAVLPEAPPSPRHRHRRRFSPALFWTAVAVTAGLTGASIALSAQTLSRRSEYESRPTREGYESFTNLRLATNIFWSFTAAAAGSSTVLFFFTDFGGQQAERRAMIGGRASF